jgi:hypothetical protein
MKKVLFVIIAVLIIIPILPRIIPKALTIERVQEGFKAGGFYVENVQGVSPARLEAEKQWTMTVAGALVDVYFYTNVGVIAKQAEYQKKDVGTAIVETWNLSESLGAAPDPNVPSFSARNGMFLIVATTPDKGLGARIATAFSKL